MRNKLTPKVRSMGTMPVFMTAISTILGAILFLRFGYAVSNVGLFLTLMIIVLGHAVTIPTAMAVAEIATNQKVEGGGAYYIISRSFGLNIGGAIGIALYLSQAISVAFYVIAFSVACEDIIPIANQWLGSHYPGLHWQISSTTLNYTVMGGLTLLMLTKGANVGMKALYLVVFLLALALLMFFLGRTDYFPAEIDLFSKVGKSGFRDSPDTFFMVFTIIFPAFTGIAAGLGLSGDLRDPKKSIPRGTLWATIVGVLIYVSVAVKLYFSVPQEAMADNEMVMEEIALWGGIIPIGLGAAAISSALGSIIIAPRTMQAMGLDQVLPGSFGRIMAKGKAKDNEPVFASMLTAVIGFVFVSLGELDVVAQIISMFFMLTYGAICMVSFFEHLAADPAYRPTFRSKWYLSLGGGILSFVLMFKMNFNYALVSLLSMGLLYVLISKKNKGRHGVAHLFKGVIFQITRRMQIYLQTKDQSDAEERWRPFVLAISQDTFERRSGFDMVRWLGYRSGFATYIHFIHGFLGEETRKESINVRNRLIRMAADERSRVYLDTIISPSFTSAIAQSVQLPGVSGKGNNMMLFDFDLEHAGNVQEMIDNFAILKASRLDVCLLRGTLKGFGGRRHIHIWITSTDYENSNLMILLGYILLGHPEWKQADISIFSIYEGEDSQQKEEKLMRLISSGRLPISPKNIQLLHQEVGMDYKVLINQMSSDADLTLVGFNDKDVAEHGREAFDGFEEVGNMLFVHTQRVMDIV